MPDPEACFQELWRVFAEPDVWRLYDDVQPALAALGVAPDRALYIGDSYRLSVPIHP